MRVEVGNGVPIGADSYLLDQALILSVEGVPMLAERTWRYPAFEALATSACRLHKQWQ